MENEPDRWHWQKPGTAWKGIGIYHVTMVIPSHLADNGFGEYYKPSDALFDSVAAGRMLILSPHSYDAKKRHITRNECVMLNNLAEEITCL